MIIESNYTLNSELEVIHENTNLVIVDEVNNIVHFLGELEADIISCLGTPVTVTALFDSVSKKYEGCNKEELEIFINQLVEKNIVIPC